MFVVGHVASYPVRRVPRYGTYSASWNTTRTKVTRGIWRDTFRSGVLTPHTVATTIESKRTDSRWRPPSEEDQSQTQARAYAAMTLASCSQTAACGGAETAEPPATSAAVQTPPHQRSSRQRRRKPTTTAPPRADHHGASATDNKPAQRRRPSKASSDRGAENAWYVFNEAKLDPTERAKVEPRWQRYTGDALRLGFATISISYVRRTASP